MRLLLSLPAIGAAAAEPAIPPLKPDVEFAKLRDVSLTLDAFVPEGADPFPICILVYGGGSLFNAHSPLTLAPFLTLITLYRTRGAQQSKPRLSLTISALYKVGRRNWRDAGRISGSWRMTWHTEIGERTLKGAEAALFRESLGSVVDMAEAEIAGDSDPWEFGVPVFDQLAAPAKLALLAEVGWALLRDTNVCPKLTAINEAAVAALFANIEHSLQFEVDAQKDGYEDSQFWRPLVVAVFRDIGDTIDLPDPDCTDIEEWNLLVDVLSQRILWDDDFNDAERYLDAPPDEADSLRDKFGIDDDYYRAIPPDPSETELPAIRAKHRDLYRGRQ